MQDKELQQWWARMAVQFASIVEQLLSVLPLQKLHDVEDDPMDEDDVAHSAATSSSGKPFYLRCGLFQENIFWESKFLRHPRVRARVHSSCIIMNLIDMPDSLMQVCCGGMCHALWLTPSRPNRYTWQRQPS